MFSSTSRSGVCWMSPFRSRKERPAIDFQSFPSAISLMVKSNSLRAAKSTMGADLRLPSASTAALAPISPALSAGFASLSAAIALTSEANDGVEVCSTARSKFFASAATSASEVPCGGASISLLSGTRAAGCASQVGYQNDRISRFDW